MRLSTTQITKQVLSNVFQNLKGILLLTDWECNGQKKSMNYILSISLFAPFFSNIKKILNLSELQKFSHVTRTNPMKAWSTMRSSGAVSKFPTHPRLFSISSTNLAPRLVASQPDSSWKSINASDQWMLLVNINAIY